MANLTRLPFAPQMEDYFLPSVKQIVDTARKLANYYDFEKTAEHNSLPALRKYCD